MADGDFPWDGSSAAEARGRSTALLRQVVRREALEPEDALPDVVVVHESAKVEPPATPRAGLPDEVVGGAEAGEGEEASDGGAVKTPTAREKTQSTEPRLRSAERRQEELTGRRNVDAKVAEVPEAGDRVDQDGPDEGGVRAEGDPAGGVGGGDAEGSPGARQPDEDQDHEGERAEGVTPA